MSYITKIKAIDKIEIFDIGSEPERVEPLTDSLYQTKLSRRESLKWFASTMASIAIPASFLNQSFASTNNTNETAEKVADWPNLTLQEITGAGYGQDPNLIASATPWPLTLTSIQLDLLAHLCNILIPAEGSVPSASQVGIPDVIDEWISAPYPLQQQHRSLLLPGLIWIDNESIRRFNKPFVKVGLVKQEQIVDTIAFPNTGNKALALPIAFFSGLRYLVVGFFVTTAEGSNDLGYMGNTPIPGEYPGPTDEALAHLEGVLEKLGLSL